MLLTQRLGAALGGKRRFWFSAAAVAAILTVISLSLVPDMEPRPSPNDPAKPTCGESLQSLVDAAAPRAVVEAPGGCVYRETVTIDTPLTLRGDPEAEIRGSEVWTGWAKSGPYWVKGSLPDLSAHGQCEEGSSRCLWPEQVFFDSRPLSQVASDPESGQFAVDGRRNIVLADDPTGHTVEVTVRQQWIVGESASVTIEGFTMRHAGNDSQRSGALSNRGHSDWTIQDNALSDAHGAVVSLTNGSNLELINNDISRGGQLGVHSARGDLLMRNNRVHHNNTEGFDAGWEAGGAKTSTMVSLTADGNEVFGNEGPGFWCDEGCRNAIYSNNHVHHNQRMGVLFEIGSGAEISGNALWENGWGFSAWGWGAGIVSSSSRDVEIHDNTLAWNADGISVISADRDVGENGTAYDHVTGVYVHDNRMVLKKLNQEPHEYSLAWLDQKTRKTVTRAGSGNAGTDNRYWYGGPEGSHDRYSWGTDHFAKLSSFNATLGEERGRYLSDVEKEDALSSAGIPASPESR